ncbi:hypothetical protein LCGC14_0464680 [marine sediment metagenome]|uniref:Uncharacterized protein n=1 Tax=marine sediment metagenome TaxID=412755 RepID=A0A0F9V0R8_9ZZZZ
MAEEVTLALLILGTVVFMFFAFYMYFTLGNKNIRTLLVMSLPMLKKGRVLDIHLARNRTVNLQLLAIEKNRLAKHTIKDGKDITKNKDIDPGSNFIEPGSNTPTFFTTDGSSITLDPTKGKGLSEMDEITVNNAFEAGAALSDYVLNSSNRPDIKGMGFGILVAVLTVAVLFLVGMMFQVNGNQITIIELLAG